jgi:hypothetical protein
LQELTVRSLQHFVPIDNFLTAGANFKHQSLTKQYIDPFTEINPPQFMGLRPDSEHHHATTKHEKLMFAGQQTQNFLLHFVVIQFHFCSLLTIIVNIILCFGGLFSIVSSL